MWFELSLLQDQPILLRYVSNTISFNSDFARKVNFYRDIFTKKITDLLMGKRSGDTTEIKSIMKDIVPPYAQDNKFSIEQRQFDRLYSAPLKIEPRFGRFYPKGLLKAIEGVFKGNIEPFRCTGISDSKITVDFNHPLSQKDGNLTVIIKNVNRKSGEIGGSCTDWLELVTSGPGMQTRCSGNPTDFFSDEPFNRTNEDEDAIFYSEPRLVTHIDDTAILVIRHIYGLTLKNGFKFRILQEALTNIARHSQATQAAISLLPHQSDISLEILDNGIGITQEQIRDFKSLGIHGMEERAMVFGGQVYIEGIAGKGTTVKVEIPID